MFIAHFHHRLQDHNKTGRSEKRKSQMTLRQVPAGAGQIY
jgi:hypothetical protein